MIPTVSSNDKESTDKSNPLHSTKELFVGDLSSFCTENDLRNIFSDYGEVIFVEIKRGRHKESLLHGFVEMSNCSEATKALEAVNGMRFKGRKMRVNFTHLSNPPSLESLTWTHIQVNFVSLNIEKEIDEEYLQAIFAKFGTIGDSVVKRHSVIEEPSPHILGYAFIYFETATAAIDAISSMDNATVDDVRYECRFGPPKKEIQKNKKKKLKQERLEQHQQQHHVSFAQTNKSRDPMEMTSELSFPPPPQSGWGTLKSPSKSAVAFSSLPNSSEIEYNVSRSLDNKQQHYQYHHDMNIPQVSPREMLLSQDTASNLPHRLIRTDHAPLSEALIEAAQTRHKGTIDPRTIMSNSNNRHIGTNHARNDFLRRPLLSQQSQTSLMNNSTAINSATSDNMYEYEPIQSNITLEQWQSFVQQQLHHQPSITRARSFSEVQPHSSSSFNNQIMMARASPPTPFSISPAQQLVNNHNNGNNPPYYSISTQHNSLAQTQRHTHRFQTTSESTPIYPNRKIIRATATDPQQSAYLNPLYPLREAPLRTSLYPSHPSNISLPPSNAYANFPSSTLPDTFPISTTTTTTSSHSSSSSSISPFLVPPESPSILGSKSITRTASSASNSSSTSSSQPMVITPVETRYSFVDVNRHNKSHITLPRSLPSYPNNLLSNLVSHNSNSSISSTFPTFSSDAMSSLSIHLTNNQNPPSASLSTQQQSIAYSSTSPR